MPNDQTIEDLLARLERERLQADRLYNEALTAVDRALQSVPILPDAPGPYDTSRLADLNKTWNILPDGAPSTESSSSLKARLRRFVWRIVGPSFETQKRFNAALVDHLNRNTQPLGKTSEAVAALIEAVGRELGALVRFESLLIQALQTITVYVDSKDRSLGGPEIRQRLALNEQRLLALKRDVEGSAGRPEGTAIGRGTGSGDLFSGSVDSLTYVGFEDRFRGSEEAIRRRVEDYVPDSGCRVGRPWTSGVGVGNFWVCCGSEACRPRG